MAEHIERSGEASRVLCGWVLVQGAWWHSPQTAACLAGLYVLTNAAMQLWLGAGSIQSLLAILLFDLLEPYLFSWHRSAQLPEMPAAAWQHGLCCLAFSLCGPCRSWTVFMGTAQDPRSAATCCGPS